jgi:hypothetical protein
MAGSLQLMLRIAAASTLPLAPRALRLPPRPTPPHTTPPHPTPPHPADPYLVQRYGSLSAAPVRLMHKTYFGVKSQPDEQVGLCVREGLGRVGCGVEWGQVSGWVDGGCWC